MENRVKFKPNPDLKLMGQVREVIRYHHYSYRTEQTYCHWIKRYIYFNGNKAHPRQMGRFHVEKFLSHLATEGNVSAATQRQAMNALVFLYRNVLNMSLGDLAPVRSKKIPSPPAVLTQEEIQSVFKNLTGLNALMAKILYGAGLRIMELIRLRVQDLDFG